MNSIDIFSMALSLNKPWFVEDVEFKPIGGSKELHITLNFERGFRFTTKNDKTTTAYDTADRTWQHLNFFQHKCYLNARVPIVKNEDGTISSIQVPWARENSGFTLMFEAYAMLLIESEMPVSKVSECIKVTAPRIWRVFGYWIKRAISKDSLKEVKRVGLDETSRKKGHNYIIQFVDMDTKRTIFVTPGKDAQTLASFSKELENKGGNKENLDLISMDMSPAFISGCMDNFPNAQIVFDKFHLVQYLNKALDDVRKLERKDVELLKGQKYTFLRNYNHLTKEKKELLQGLLMMYPKLGDAYRLRELFMDAFRIADPNEAKGYLWFWCDQAILSGIAPFKKFVGMIRSHWSGVTAYFDHRVTNGILEGINSKIQLAKRRARGYRNVENFINMMYFLSAKLKFDYPHYSL